MQPTPSSGRQWELDALRGLMLVLMTLTHMPTGFSPVLSQPFGFVSAAEGFVLISAILAGRVYAARGERHGFAALRRGLWQRAGKLYLCHAGLLLLAFTLIAWLGVVRHQGGVTGLLEYFFIAPATAVPAAFALAYNPPLLDVLPLYIVLMLVSPWLIAHGQRHGWRGLLCLSVLVWLAEQWGLSAGLHALARDLGWPVPYRDMGAFHTFGWQLLWVVGLWLGARRAPWPVLRWWVWLPALVFVSTTLVWRHTVGQDPMPGVPAVAALFDKWSLGPLRLLNLAAMVALLLASAPLWRALPRPRPLELLGRQSLPVFCAHIVIALFTLAFFGSVEVLRPRSTDLLLLAAAFAGLFAVALVAQRRDQGGGLRLADALR
ncbi:MAG: OpgC domain-containing protein [Hydrogenophaga sp.]|uniref:Succinyl transferase OpgC n=1 Tax=Hydrogenophaga crocea TaxID=2716225 RepID=A0A6G8IFR4_9BURK|nr:MULTISPECIES: OpgC domain-containing protein [Hydrogenophaga]MBL0946218.1 OpgC domain-containing protein [Hydrogenophaga sp.]QIM51983.1 succinyl transferase OpgC [Hydrogenophaga crocea]